MGGQVLGGGVIVLVAVVLWLVYLLPSWHSRHQYDAAERNAVRLNQALRVLAETSETPQEVRLELNARTALAQQKLARRALAEREDIARRAQQERDQAELERQRADLERARRERAAVRETPESRRGRARRRARILVCTVAAVALALAGWGAWDVVRTGSQVVLWSAFGLAAVCAVLLVRMARVSSRRTARDYVDRVFTTEPAQVQDVALPHDRAVTWSPRELPRPLTASAGSRAAAMLDAAAEREAVRRAAREEAMLARAERRRISSIETARARREAAMQASAAASDLADDAEIEAHVREMLRRRVAG